MKKAVAKIATRPVEKMIHVVWGQRVMLDYDLASVYGVMTKVLNQAVRRNMGRFPEDFMFQLTKEEAESSRSQFVTLNKRRGQNVKYAPYAFTEHGVAMLSSVLKSQRAVQMNILIIRAFVRMRDLMVTHKDLQHRVDKLESKHQMTDAVIETLVEDIEKINHDIRWIKNPPVVKKQRMGYL